MDPTVPSDVIKMESSAAISQAEMALVPAENFTSLEHFWDFPPMDPFNHYSWDDFLFMESLIPPPLKVEDDFAHLNAVHFTSLWDHQDFSSGQNNVLVGAVPDSRLDGSGGSSSDERGKGCHSEGIVVPTAAAESSTSATREALGLVLERSPRSNTLDFEEISQYFYVPITQAAKELKVGLTVLKKRCRELGISRWPHRKMKSLNSLIHNVQELKRSNGAPGEISVRREEIERLEEHKKLMEKRPELQLSEETKKLRQACFKANYKKRRLMGIPACP